MGWSGSLTTGSALGSAITYTPSATDIGAYSVGSFTAPKRGIYQFKLKGSGGAKHDVSSGSISDGGVGGSTTGYLLLEAGQTVYVGAGGPCSAAFVAESDGDALKDITKSNLYFVAGAGGGGGGNWGQDWGMSSGAGGKGGGSSGAAGVSQNGTGGAGGTQSGGYAYGCGGGGGYSNHDDTSLWAGRGGDGYYGGKGGNDAAGGGGGSGYVKTASLSVGGKTYSSTTSQGGGASSNKKGSVVVTYYAIADLPIYFNGKQLTEIFFNGESVTSLVYGGKKLFARALERIRGWKAVLA